MKLLGRAAATLFAACFLLFIALVIAEGFGVRPARAQFTAAYGETTVTVGTSWVQLLGPGQRQRVIIGDAAGVGCLFSFSASPAANEGFPFSDAGLKGSWVFDNPQASGAIYGKCQSAGTIVTVAVS